MFILFIAFFCFDFAPDKNLNWRPTDTPEQVALYQGDTQIGIFKVPEREYLNLNKNGDFEPSQLPFPIPEKYLELFPIKKILNYGIDLSEMKGRPESYYHNGRAITKESALHLMGATGIPDDSALLRLTVIGGDSIRKQIKDDLFNDPNLKEFRQIVLLQDYPVSHWAVTGVGFDTTGEVAIYVQSPDGTVIHKQTDYRDGPAGLAAALRKADPNYRRGGDPDLRDNLNGSLLVFIGIVTICIAAYFFRRID